MKYIYTITAVRVMEDSNGVIDTSDDGKRYSITERCWGWFTDLRFLNGFGLGDFSCLCEDGHYQYLVVEKVREGLACYDYKPIWFKVSKRGSARQLKNTPKFFKNTIGWSMG